MNYMPLSFGRTLASALLLSALSLLAFAAEPTRRFDLPAGEASQTLKRYAAQAGREIVFSPAQVGDITTRAVQGELPVREALDLMLADTGLAVTEDARTGVLAVSRAPASASVETGSASETPSTDSASFSGRVEPGIVKLEKVEVTGSRIRSILGEQGINPVLTFTRADIEKSGVTSLSDLRALIPQLSVGNTTAFDGNSAGSSPNGRLAFTLRGITGNNTLVLVDGRRLPRTGQRVAATENYEITGLPLSAIERVEVLLDGASAVYGADAIGGVVNIITRKNYTGSELEFAYDNTTDQDAANKRVSFNTSYRSGSLSVRASASYEAQSALARRDRWWLASDDRRFIGGLDGRTSNPYITGSVRMPNFSALPGTNGATELRIPANSTGRNLTIADFVAAGAPTSAEYYDTGLTQNALNEFDRWSTSANVTYAIRPWLNAYADYSFGRIRSYGNSGPVLLTTFTNFSFPQFSTTLPANYPGNPFGVPINVRKVFWELGSKDVRYQMDTRALNFGVRGELAHDWRYDAGISWSKSNPNLLDPLFQFDITKLGPAIQSASPPVLLNNSLTLVPANPAGTLEQYFGTGANQDVPETWTYELRADGPVYTWWGGQINAALGTEMREEYVDFNRQNFAAATEAAQPARPRVVKSGYAELAVPVVSPESKIRLVNSLTASFAVRRDSYNDFDAATKPRYGATYRPWSWLMLRATHSEAYKVPPLAELNRPLTLGPGVFFGNSFTDTARNELISGVRQDISVTTGGNPALKPEQSVSRNFGFVLEPPLKALKGLSLSADFWEINITDRVSTGIDFQERFDLFPGMFTREAPTPADVAANRPGKIIAIDNRSLNIAFFNTSGQDFSLRYSRNFGEWGDFTLRADATRTTRFESIGRAGVPPSASISPLVRPTRGTASLDWLRHGLGFGVTATYQDRFRTSATSAATETASTTLWNLRASYDFDQGRLLRFQGKWAKAFAGVRVNAALLNAWDLEPPLTTSGVPSGAVDPRLRRYTLTIRKAF